MLKYSKKLSNVNRQYTNLLFKTDDFTNWLLIVVNKILNEKLIRPKPCKSLVSNSLLFSYLLYYILHITIQCMGTCNFDFQTPFWFLSTQSTGHNWQFHTEINGFND